MKTELTTRHQTSPNWIEYDDSSENGSLTIEGHDNNIIYFDKSEIKELRDFLNQLDLG